MAVTGTSSLSPAWLARAAPSVRGQQRGARVHYLTGPPRHGANDPLAPRRLQRLVPDLRRHDVFLCGPDGMMAAAQASLLQAGVPRRHIHSESFTF